METVATSTDERHRVRADSLEPGEWLAPSETGTAEPGEVLGSFDYGVYGVVYRLRTGSDPRVLTCGPSALVDMATAGEINPPSPYGALADELERIAADLRRVDLPVSPYFQINIQPAPSRRGDDKAVVAAVDAVAMAVYGKTGADARMGDGSYHYNIDGRRGPIAVSIYQGISAPARPEPEPELVGPREVDNGDHPDPLAPGVFGDHEGDPAGRTGRPRCSPECQAQWSPDGDPIVHLPDCPHGVALRATARATTNMASVGQRYAWACAVRGRADWIAGAAAAARTLPTHVRMAEDALIGEAHVEALAENVVRDGVAPCGCPVHPDPEVAVYGTTTVVRHVDGCDADGSVD